MRVRDICVGIADGSHNPPQGIEMSDYLMLSSKNIFDDEITFDNPRYLAQSDFEQEDRRTKVMAGNVLLTIVGTVGRAAVVDEKMPRFTLQRSVAVLKPKDDVCNSRYLMYALQGKRTYIENSAKGVAQKGIYLNEVSNIDLRIPALYEQESIVILLDKITAVTRSYQKQIQKLDELVKSRFVELFKACKDYKRLEEHAALITKGASPKWQGVDYCEKGTLFVTSENVRECYLDLSKRKYLDDKINEIQPRSILKRNDILINIVGASIGRAAVYDCDELANINQAVALVRVDFSRINQTYLMTFLNSQQAIEMYGKMKKGGARDNLSLQNIADLKIPVAPMERQKEFAAFVSEVDKSKLAVKQSLEKLETLKKSLMQQYFG